MEYLWDSFPAKLNCIYVWGQSQITLYGLYQLGIQDEGDLSQTTYGAVTVVADTLQQEKTFDRMPGGVSPY